MAGSVSGACGPLSGGLAKTGGARYAVEGGNVAEHLYTFVRPANPKHLARLVSVLEDGGVLVLPAGTNWMFACDAASRRGMERIRALKPEHPDDRPFSLICDAMATVSRYARVDGGAFRVLNRLWPGPYTVLLPASRDLPRLLKNKREVVGVRVPDEEITREIVAFFGKPLAGTTVPSAPDGGTHTMGWAVADAFGHGVDVVVDLGEELPGTETTIVDLLDGVPRVVRVGAGPVDGLVVA
jgi:tRNA threonylcarbamoyl adenosine modification protein (Sua5/YciO/YrdC/YwlC family)